VREIRSFIKNKNKANLYVQQDDRWVGYLVGGIFAGVGAIMIVTAPITLLREGL